MADSNVSVTISARDAASAQIKRIQRAFGDLKSEFLSFSGLVKMATGALAGLSLGVILKDLLDLGTTVDKSMRQIAASLPTGVAGLRDLKAEIAGVAQASGRSVGDIRDAAVAIAHLGVSSSEEVAARLKAATLFADATGADLKGTVEGLDQIMDLYSLSAKEAEVTLAKLASAAKGRTDPEALFGAFAAAAPVLAKLGIDADTATRAMVALLDKGFNGKAVRAAIASFDADGIRQLAKEAKISGTALEEMAKSADIVRAGSDRVEQAVKNRLIVQFERLGTHLTRVLHPILKETADLLDYIQAKGNGKGVAMGFSETSIASGWAKGLGGKTNAPTARDLAGEGVAAPSSIGTPKLGGLPQTIEEKKAAAEAAAKAAAATKKLVDEAEQQAARVADVLSKGAKYIAAFTTTAVDQLDEQMREQVAELWKGQKDMASNPSQWRAGFDQITALEAKYASLRAVLVQVADAEREAAAAQDLLDSPTASDGDLGAEAERLSEKYNELWKVREKLTRGTKDYEAAEKGLVVVEGQIGAISARIAQHDEREAKRQSNRLDLLKKLGTALTEYGRAGIAAAQAIGAISSEAAASLQNLLTLGEGLHKIFSMGADHDLTGGITSAVSAMGAIIGTMFGPNPEAIAARKVMNTNTEALLALRDSLHSTGLNVTGRDLSTAQGQLAKLRGFTPLTAFGQTGDGQKTGLAEFFKANGIDSTLLHQVAQALGVTIDDTIGSYKKLAEAVEIASGRVAKFGTSFQDLTTEADAYARIFGITDPRELLKLHAQAGVASSSTISGLFSGIDVGSNASLNELLKRIEDTFTRMQGGGAGIDLGGLTRDEFLQLLELLSGDIRGLTGSVDHLSDTVLGIPRGINLSLLAYRSLSVPVNLPGYVTQTLGTGTLAGTIARGAAPAAGTTSGSAGRSQGGSDDVGGTQVIEVSLDSEKILRAVVRKGEQVSQRVNGTTRDWAKVSSRQI